LAVILLVEGNHSVRLTGALGHIVVENQKFIFVFARWRL